LVGLSFSGMGWHLSSETWHQDGKPVFLFSRHAANLHLNPPGGTGQSLGSVLDCVHKEGWEEGDPDGERERERESARAN
jgi:hypothetical protein